MMDCSSCNSYFYLRDAVLFMILRARELERVGADQIEGWNDDLEDLFGIEGLLRGIGHLMRDVQQNQFVDQTLARMTFSSYLCRTDYWAKWSQMMHLQPKKEGYGAAMISIHGNFIMFKVVSS
jgi:hypothetical protein